VACQDQGCRQACRAGTDDDRAVIQRRRSRLYRWQRLLHQLPYILIITAMLPHTRFIITFDIYREHKINPRFPPGIDGPADNTNILYIPAAAMHFSGHKKFQWLFHRHRRMYIQNSQHVSRSFIHPYLS
jgi:hypothetical protein